MKNEHSTDGLAEDLIRSMLQLACAELHAKTLLEKMQSELETGVVDAEGKELMEHLEKFQSVNDDLNEYAYLRRNDMLTLYEMYGETGDKQQWCMVKHLGLASVTAFEAYQASDDDADLFDCWMKKNKAFIKSMSAFLGTEITECAACFADMLKGE